MNPKELGRLVVRNCGREKAMHNSNLSGKLLRITALAALHFMENPEGKIQKDSLIKSLSFMLELGVKEQKKWGWVMGALILLKPESFGEEQKKRAAVIIRSSKYKCPTSLKANEK